ncbi:MAG: hypothetical protein Q8O40_13685 [Chloroflexota bacterium]|nr:hypothetical protein [Chloroflexota bacterium]
MLGEKIGEERGKATGTRVLPGGDYRYLRMEVSFQAAGKLLGMDSSNVGTYTVFERVPGQLYGEGQGIVMTSDGQSAIWNGHGVGRMTGKGMGMSFRFAIAFQAAQGSKLARLNGVLVIGEDEVDENGNAHTTTWEWK